MIRPGSILPVNYELWPKKSGKIVMAMVTKVEEHWLRLCPVHCNPEAASYSDLVIMPQDTPLNTFMVVMGRLSSDFPSCALAHEVFASPLSPRMCALQLSNQECLRLRNKLLCLTATSKMPDSSVGICRGEHLPFGSAGDRWARKLAADWLDFSSSVWQFDFAQHHLQDKNINISFIIKEIEQSLRANFETMQSPPQPTVWVDEHTPIFSRSSYGRIGEIEDLPEPIEDLPEPIEVLRDKLNELLRKSNLINSDTLKLLQGTMMDLLKLLYRLFPGEKTS